MYEHLCLEEKKSVSEKATPRNNKKERNARWKYVEISGSKIFANLCDVLEAAADLRHHLYLFFLRFLLTSFAPFLHPQRRVAS